jgi:hypothetical protein
VDPGRAALQRTGHIPGHEDAHLFLLEDVLLERALEYSNLPVSSMFYCLFDLQSCI